MIRAVVFVIGLACSGSYLTSGCFAAVPTAETFAFLDTVPDKLDVCVQARGLDEIEDMAAILPAMERDIACLTALTVEVASLFYPSDAFGEGRDGSLEARLAKVTGELLPVFIGLQTRPLACDPNCDPYYLLQAYDMQIRFLHMLIMDMTERLKDDSPVHIE